MRRVETLRHVLFSDFFDSSSLVRDGVAIDMSAGGLRIRTHYPQKIGQDLHIEIKPKEGDTESPVVMFRGRVRHISKLDNGAYTMGIRLHPKSASKALSPMRPKKTALDPNLSKRKKPNTAPRARTAEIESSPSILKVSREAVNPSGGRRERWKNPITRWRLAVLLIALLLALLFLRGEKPPASADRMFGPSIRSGGVAPPAPEPKPPTPSRSGIVGANTLHTEWAATESQPLILPESVAGLISLAQSASMRVASLNPGALNEESLDRALFERAQHHPKASAVERFIATLGHAEAAASDGEIGLALALLRKADSMDPAKVPEAWRDMLGDSRSQIEASQRVAAGLGSMDEVLELRPVGVASVTPPAISIEVDTSRYLLTLLRHGEPLRSFPVGLGRDGSTPLGRFEIVNKITDPDWYNRGVVVPAGSPDNLLGRRWMGMGVNRRPTPYGIHGTPLPKSIGQALSRGCVRMRPKDVEAVFRLCPIGTPVYIHS
jgi:lipoprotein-anchoring transpeptidase ErfK/SrfK